MPKCSEYSQLGDCELQHSGKILAINWLGKCDITMMSTIHQGDMKDSGKEDCKTKEAVMKPDAVLDYNENMHP